MLATLDDVNVRRSDPIRLRERDLIISAEKKKRSAFCHACLAESMAVQPDGGIFLDYFDLCNELGGHVSSGSNSAHPNNARFSFIFVPGALLYCKDLFRLTVCSQK